MLDPDFNEFYEVLLDATRKTFVDTREDRPNETFYAFGLTYKMTHTVTPICNTEQFHRQRDKFTDEDRANQTLQWAYSRWHFSEWLYPGPGRDYFGPVVKWISAHMDLREQVKVPAESSEYLALKNGFLDSCLKTLKTLDQEALFGQGQDREQVTVIMMGLIPFGRMPTLDYIQQLNSPSTYERWRIEWELCRHAREALSTDRFDE